jgi:hypothetical protein
MRQEMAREEATTAPAATRKGEIELDRLLAWFGLAIKRLGKASAQSLKKAILDLRDDAAAAAPAELPEVKPLPPLPRAAFCDALRGRIDEAISDTVDAINETESESSLNDTALLVREHFARLRWEAVELALQLRIDAAMGRKPSPPAPLSWAEKYRLMKLAEAAKEIGDCHE